MSHLSATEIAQEMWGGGMDASEGVTALEIHDIILAMSVVRAARWLVEGYSSERGEWRTIYEGTDLRTAIHAVQDHDHTRVNYYYGAWREING